MKPTLFTIRNVFSIPLVGLGACLAAIIFLVQLEPADLDPVTSLPAHRDHGGRKRLENFVALSVQVEKTRTKMAAELRQLEARLNALGADARKTGPNKSDGSVALKMRSLVRQIAVGMLLGAQESWDGSSTQEGAAEFRELLSASRRWASIPREKALLDDIEERFGDVLTLGAELKNVAAERDRKMPALGSFAAGRSWIAAAEAKKDAVLQGLSVRWALTGLAIGAILCAVAAFQQTTRRIAKPVTHLVETARAITYGKERKRASLKAAGDLRDLAEAFNQMIDARQQAEERLKASHEKLELRVTARTAELWHANVALREESEQRARAEREFQQAQKMDALGKLAGSIAHDFNNLLTVIIGGSECVRKQLGPDHPGVPMLQTVEKAGERAAGLTRPLLTFSRTQVLTLEKLNLNDAAQEAERMLHRLVGINIHLRLDLAPNVRPLRANANQIQQVLLNLGVNARDAMEGIGHLTISTRNVTIDPSESSRHGAEPAEHWVELTVTDTGCGMDAETKARIFEPFFTTKAPGKGTGLGLSTVFGIVRQSGGFVEVESSPGEGTAFRVLFPVNPAAELAATPAARVVARQEPRPANQTVLLVDDEDDIRELATMTLEEHGYRILSAPNAEEAIVLGEKHALEISALVTDVIMPGMTGVQLAGVLGKLIPGLRVLFVSGHSNETITEETLSATRASYLQKPYFGDALAAKVAEVLAEPWAMAASVP